MSRGPVASGNGSSPVPASLAASVPEPYLPHDTSSPHPVGRERQDEREGGREGGRQGRIEGEVRGMLYIGFSKVQNFANA